MTTTSQSRFVLAPASAGALAVRPIARRISIAISIRIAITACNFEVRPG